MKGKEKYCSSIDSHDSDDDDDDLESCPDPDTKLDLLLEKLNLGARKKLLVLSLSGLLMYRVNVRDENIIPKSRTPDWKYANSLSKYSFFVY